MSEQCPPKQIAKIAKALADETRLHIYEAIAAQMK